MILQIFFIPCDPPTTTAQQKGAFICAGKIRFFKKAKVAQAENTLISLFYNHAPEQPHNGALRVTITLFFPFRKTEKKADIASGISCHTSRPDFDNLSKMLCDTLTTLRFWNDDGQISDGRIIKRRATKTGIEVKIERDEIG
jgi:Holliday junction resolvase RusA-like endonuclease